MGRPNIYLTGPDLVISQERARERTVLDTNTTGRDPAREVLTDREGNAIAWLRLWLIFPFLLRGTENKKLNLQK